MNWLTSFKSTFVTATLGLLWDQWSDLGVLGQTAGTANWILDPEALVLTTIQFGRYDPRLFDASIDWCLTNGMWLNSARLQRLRKVLDPVEQRAFSAVAQILLETNKSPKWISLSRTNDASTPPGDAVPLFLLPEGEPLPRVGRPDPTFLRNGLLRSSFEARKVSTKVAMDRLAALRIRLRAFMGVTSRPEIILYLLTHKRAYPRLVARQEHFAQPPVAKAMADMALSGLISKYRTDREVEYELDATSWSRFLRLPELLVWINWVSVFQVMRGVLARINELEGRKVTPSVLGSELDRYVREANPILYESGIGFAFKEATPGEPESYPDLFMANTRELFERIRFRSFPTSLSAQPPKLKTYEESLDEARRLLRERSRIASPRQTFREVTFYPSEYVAEVLPREELLQWLKTARTRYRGNPFPWIIEDMINPIPDGITFLHEEREGPFGTRVDYWYLSRSGFFYYAEIPWEDTYGVKIGGPVFSHGIGVRSVVELLFAAVRLSLRLYKDIPTISALNISLRLREAAGRHLVVDDPNRAPFTREYVCDVPEVVTSRIIQRTIGESDLHNEIVSMAADVFWMFGWSDAKDVIRDLVPKFEEDLRRTGYESDQ